ncbi:Lateral organ boundaries, LOB [Dillenia turbinata]|uniref:Lateral organ boundaries, LOB n=1 Tax=Dillenia turbinata TaxID=194707 RepID=A0AAN8URB6_9MAGN
MRMSCNGCRVLRKGCSEDCSIRPCLQWIKNPESQANATVFLAKFYGRAGLLNLINTGPEHLRPAIFRSLLYEASGRIVNPIYGAVGLLWSGNWQRCQAAVDSVLKGLPIKPSSEDIADAVSGVSNSHTLLPLRSCDIRHASKADISSDLHKIKTRARFKRSTTKTHNSQVDSIIDFTREAALESSQFGCCYEFNRSASHESPLIQQDEPAYVNSEDESVFCVVEPTISNRVFLEPGSNSKSSDCQTDEREVELELTL